MTQTVQLPHVAGLVSEERYRDAMSLALTGVTVVASDGPAGRFGQTVSAMSSVAVEPPMLLVCVNQRSPLSAAIETNGAFTVNVLADDQVDLAESFAGRSPSRGRAAYDFLSHEWADSQYGLPAAVGAIATFDCRLADVVQAGTHRIFLGTVRALHGTNRQTSPLAYHARRFGRHTPLPG